MEGTVLKCSGKIDGRECGRILSPKVKFCIDCGKKNDGLSNCEKCGTILQIGQEFCGECGQRVQVAQVNLIPLVCSGRKQDGIPCGRQLLPGFSFCPFCSTPVQAPNIQVDQGHQQCEPKELNKNRLPLVTAVSADTTTTTVSVDERVCTQNNTRLCNGKNADGSQCTVGCDPGINFCASCDVNRENQGPSLFPDVQNEVQSSYGLQNISAEENKNNNSNYRPDSDTLCSRPDNSTEKELWKNTFKAAASDAKFPEDERKSNQKDSSERVKNDNSIDNAAYFKTHTRADLDEFLLRDKVLQQESRGNEDTCLASPEIVDRADKSNEETLKETTNRGTPYDFEYDLDRTCSIEKHISESNRDTTGEHTSESERTTSAHNASESDRASSEKQISENDIASSEKQISESDRASGETQISESDRASSEKQISESDRASCEKLILERDNANIEKHTSERNSIEDHSSEREIANSTEDHSSEKEIASSTEDHSSEREIANSTEDHSSEREIANSTEDHSSEREIANSTEDHSSERERANSTGKHTSEREIANSIGEHTSERERANSTEEHTSEGERANSTGENTSEGERANFTGEHTSEGERANSTGEHTSEGERANSSGEHTSERERANSTGEHTSERERANSTGEHTLEKERANSTGEHTPEKERANSTGEHTSEGERANSSEKCKSVRSKDISTENHASESSYNNANKTKMSELESTNSVLLKDSRTNTAQTEDNIRTHDREKVSNASSLPISVQTSNANKNQSRTTKESTRRKSSTSVGANRNNTSEKDSNTVCVVFHVIISELGEELTKKDQVFIRFEPSILGGFTPSTDDRFEMEFKRPIKNIGYLYEGQVSMPWDLRNKGFNYKYIVKQNKNSKDTTVIWEIVHRKLDSTAQTLVNRHFHIPADKKKLKDTWHRYDGVAYLPKSFSDGVLTRLKGALGGSTYRDKIRKDVQMSAVEYLPKVEDICAALQDTSVNPKVPAEAYLEKISQVICSLKLQMLDRRLENVDDELVKESILDSLIEPLFLKLQEMCDLEKHTVTLGIFVLLLVEEYSLELDYESLNLLYRSLLIIPEIERKTCPDLVQLFVHFASHTKDKRQLAKLICKYMHKSDVTWNRPPEDASWLYCIPLVHFLEEQITPFKDVEQDADFRKDEWWGISSFWRKKNSFLNVNEKQLPDKMISLLVRAFTADRLFVRSVVASLKLEPLLPLLLSGSVPLETMAATLAHHVKESVGCIAEKSVLKIIDCLTLMIANWRQHGPASNGSPNHQLKRDECLVHILREMYKALLKYDFSFRSHSNVFLEGIHLQYLVLDHMAIQEERLCAETRDVPAQEWHRQAKFITDAICTWLAKKCSLFYDDTRTKYLQMWGKLIEKSQDITYPVLQQETEKIITDHFEKEFMELNAVLKLEVYLKQQDQVVPALATVMNRLAFASLGAAFEGNSKYLASSTDVKLISLLSKFLEDEWQKQVASDNVILNFVVNWAPITNYLQKFPDETKMATLSEPSAKNLKKVLQCIEKVIKDLTTGKIQINTLHLLLPRQDQFCKVVTAARHAHDRVKALIKVRELELKAFQSANSHLNRLLEHCQKFLQADEAHTVKATVEKFQNQDLPLSVVCEIASLDSIQDLGHYRPTANPWGFDDAILLILPDVDKKMASLLFRKMFSELAQQIFSDTSLDFWRGFLMLWDRADRDWNAIRTKLADGSATIDETEKLFNLFEAEGTYKYAAIEAELKKVAGSGSVDWVEERILQFQCYADIKKHVKAAEALLQVKDVYNIQGNFADIVKICQLNQNASKPICDVDKSVLGFCEKLKHIEPKDISCLREFSTPQCKKLVEWIRKTMEGGIKELKVFVDLAFISAGEEPFSLGQVNCFHAATTGYAPLIFTEIQDLNHLLEQCKIVFKNVSADPQLPEKLNDTFRNLDWFKDVQKAHGSVEKTSLTQVGNINARGIFKVGNAVKMELNLSKIIRLDVSEDDESKTPPRTYTYDEMLDLQSRLMLVAGQAEKGKENVDRFMMIMDSLVRLGKTYIQICKDGCILFLNWSVNFLCDQNRPLCCSSEFSGQGMLKGHSSKKKNVKHFIAAVADFLENCHKEWLEYLDLKRKQYQELNMYTVEQLVFLQQELVKVGSGQVSRYVYPLLSLLKADCSRQHLELALQNAMNEVDTLEQRQQADQEQLQERQINKDDKKLVNIFLQEMKDNGFPKSLALKAMTHVDIEDIAGGIAWCIEHEEEEENEEMEVENGEEEEEGEEEDDTLPVGQRLKNWFTRDESIAQNAVKWLQNIETRNETSLKALKDNLTIIWKKFLETVSSSGADFLSLNHLGIVLKCLADLDERKFKRALPPEIKPGSPNLLLCPKYEVLNVVTYMYMFPEESLLPQPDEVLLCTEETSFEKVDIFLRRAMFGKQQKVHCLAFADYLDYDIGERVEKKIKEYLSTSGEGFRLIVVCTMENEYRARIVAALEKYQRHAPVLGTAKVVRQYLQKSFTGLLKNANIQSASSLDPEHSCVRVIKSNRSGVGKTLYVKRLAAQLKNYSHQRRALHSITIPLHCRTVHIQDIAAKLLCHTLQPDEILPRIIHLDISYEVQEGVDHLLYNLLVLGCVTDRQGHVWLRSPMDLYLVETMPLLDQKDQRGKILVHQMFDVLPSLSCWSPKDSFTIMTKPNNVPGYQKHDRLFDDEEYRSEKFQRPYQYLQRLGTNQQPQAYNQGQPTGQKVDCLAVLLKYCGVKHPSWSELQHFVCFLNKQLQDFEHSIYCSMGLNQDLPGFSVFVLRFLIQMSRDFATRSLNISEESLAALVGADMDNVDIQLYEMRRTWESSPHPYIFFNPDKHSMTFLGFFIDPQSGNLQDQQTDEILEQAIMTPQLFRCLVANHVPLTENFDILPREDRLLRLYRVMGLRDEEIFVDDEIIDPDDTYELTTDNVKKILAIYMRFRCNIPVIVMGETGCGKTRLVKFMCALQTPQNPNMNTLVLVKVHGGTTGEDIINKVHAAEEESKKNAKAFPHRPVYTVLFFDEANTTEAVGVIKEIMCDGTVNGQPVTISESLKMVAACNPYRKHSEALIKRLENAGLGYHVDADRTTDRLGRIPMRRLVYRVQPLPQSMLPLVWDFGQLDTQVETLYIMQMIKRYAQFGPLSSLDETGMNVLCTILMESQEFMRNQKDECSFVSLRDVDRTLTVFNWFLTHENGGLLHLFSDSEREDYHSFHDESQDSFEGEEEPYEPENEDDMTTALVLSLAVCYRACLRSKSDYDKHIVEYFQPPFSLYDGEDDFLDIINRCQEHFLNSVRLEENIASNQALKENVFMMVVCIELRIPLFLVGKPGSSKSLAKTIVGDAMQGTSSHPGIFTHLKQAQMVSFQCSPLATADGILGTFRQCAQYQKGKSKDSFVSVVVLDEVGLAEDSPKMPLKTLHPLLEDGCPGDELPDESKKVAFIGISNWALDPAKMNRGILVQRELPDKEELIKTAREICTTKNKQALLNVEHLIPKLAKAYLGIFEEAQQKREFFGLRDFYSLVKMVYAFAVSNEDRPSYKQLIAAIKRNFGGLDIIDPIKSFQRILHDGFSLEEPRDDDPDTTAAGLVKAALKGDKNSENRYLLLLTENFGGLNILLEHLLAGRNVVPIFGSSFPKDQEYTQICYNINRIKVCMEIGQTVILLNLENLYESLYDALNQYYAMYGGERYVDLGLGTHRVKCRVHRQFRLIVVAEKQAVYEKFPIPLINRLEKHFLTLNNIMTQDQLKLAKELEKWAENFVKSEISPQSMQRSEKKEETVGDVFMGFHHDTAPAVILKTWDKLQVDENLDRKSEVLEESKHLLLWCATPDAVVRARDNRWSRIYHKEQQHENLVQYLEHQLPEHFDSVLLAQVTTHSKLLAEHERQALCEQLPVKNIMLLSLQSFDTEQQYRQQLLTFFNMDQKEKRLLLVQCDSGDVNQNLVKCAQYCLQDMRSTHKSMHHVVFIIQLPRVAGACFTGFLGGAWHCLHIDDLRPPDRPVPPITLLQSQTPAALLMAACSALKELSGLEENKTSDLLQHQAVSLVPSLTGREFSEEEPMDVDVENITIQLPFENNNHPGLFLQPGMEDQQSKGFDIAYVQHMLISCIQGASALVHDQNTKRATRRIAILLELMEDGSGAIENNLFFKGILEMICSVMEERDKALYGAEHWLCKEAARLDMVKKAGTFRRAWMKCLEDKVTPVLAGVIAFLDTNANLDLIFDEGEEEKNPAWVYQLWLDIMQHRDVCHLTYANLQSMTGKDDLDEFMVQATNTGAVPFPPRLPFSWLVGELVENSINGVMDIDVDMLDRAGSAVATSTLGQCLQRAVSGTEEHLRQLFQFYIEDLLHFKFQVSLKEHELLCKCMDKGLQQLHIDLIQLQIGHGLVMIHIAFNQMRSRLQSILDMAAFKPDAIQILLESAGSAAYILDSREEMTEDVALLTLLVEELKPHPKQFDEESGCEEWVNKYNGAAPFIMRILNEAEASIKSSAPKTTNKHEDDEASQMSEILQFGNKCKQQLLIIRFLWTRTVTLKLFFDFVSPLRKGSVNTRKALKGVKYQLLWRLLGEEPDMKTAGTLQSVDQFLKHANGQMLKKLIGKVGKCSYCDTKPESAPVELPCKHSLCNSCFRDFCPGTRPGECPQCHKSVPKNFNPTPANAEYRHSVEELGHYQRQVSGFLMALMSQLCFAGEEPPEPAAIEHIFGYIIHRSKGKTLLKTKQMTVVDDLIDPTPVLRSFLLRLLLKHSESSVTTYLEDFFAKGREIIKQQAGPSPAELEGTPNLVELCLLVIHCIEDLHFENQVVGSNSMESFISEEEQFFLLGLLQDLNESMQNFTLSFQTLYTLGHLRYALATCASLLHSTCLKDASMVINELKDLLVEVMGVKDTWPKKFLIKQLCKEYGIHAYMALVKLAKQETWLKWICLEESNAKVEEIPDRYLVCGEAYKSLRDGLLHLRLSGDSKDLAQMLKNFRMPVDRLEGMLFLAVHKDVTMSSLHLKKDALQADKVQQAAIVKRFLQDCKVVQDKELAEQLCDNKLGQQGSPLCVSPSQDLAMQGLMCILTHVRLSLRHGAKVSQVLHPLQMLIHQPAHLVNSFLPTMPEDHIDDVLRAFTTAGTAARLWQCPKGHRYVIGDCGQPNQQSRCPTCGSAIGGMNYNAAPQNIINTGGDESRRGHILGPATSRAVEAVPERQLSALDCAFTRFFTHAALYLSANNPVQTVQVSQMLQPRLALQEVCHFFWEHLRVDLRILQRVLGRSMDDIFLVLHYICHQMTVITLGRNPVLLTTKAERSAWEKEFANTFITPAIRGLDDIIKTGNKTIMADKRQGENELLNLVHEVEERKEQESSLHNLQLSPLLWRYRPRITVDHFFRQFHLLIEREKELKDKFRVLNLFSSESHILRALHFVPAILITQRRLMLQLYRRLDRSEADKLTVQEVMSRQDCSGLDYLLKNFSKAWEIVKEHLISYRCMTPTEGLVSLPMEYHNVSITANSKLAVLLPSPRGSGLCAYLMLHFLLGRHNDFMQRYCPLINQRYKNLPEVSVRAISKRHLVGYSPEKDILPMVLAHSNYSLTVGQVTTLEYDFAAFQQQLQDTLLLCKSRVQHEQNGCIAIETMMYKADTTNSRMFKILREKIPQESLSPAERRQIAEDLRGHLPNICQSIDNLNTALSFLKALGGNPSLSLHDFMAQGLRMKQTIQSRKAQQLCFLKHVQSLWLLLCYQRAIVLAAHGQDAFDNPETKLCENLTEDQIKQLETMCQQLSIDRLELVLFQLLECVMLRLSEPPEQEEDTQPQNFGLRDLVIANLDYPLYDTQPVEVRSGQLTPEVMQTFPESLQGRHVIQTWLACYRHLLHKRQQFELN